MQGGGDRRVWLAAGPSGLTGVELRAEGTRALVCRYDPVRDYGDY